MISGLSIEHEMASLYSSLAATLHHLDKRIIMFIGSRQGEGTSTIALEFSKVAATTFGKTVFLVDIDLYQPNDDQSPDNEQEKLLQVITIMNELNHLKHDPIKLILQPSSISFLSHFEDLLNKAENNFNLLVIDSPSVSISANGLALASRVSGIVLIVEAENTRSPVVKNTIDKIKRAGGNILGIVLNKRRYYIPSVIYNRL